MFLMNKKREKFWYTMINTLVFKSQNTGKGYWDVTDVGYRVCCEKYEHSYATAAVLNKGVACLLILSAADASDWLTRLSINTR